MIIWLILLGLITGILAGDVTKSILLGWICLGIGLGLYALMKSKKISVFAIFASVGIIITVLRLGLLYDATNLYGQVTTMTVRSYKLVQVAEDYVAWQGKIIAPANFAGATVLIYSEEYSPGIYTLSGRVNPPVQYRNPGQGWHYKHKLYSGEIGSLSRPQVMNYQRVQPNYIEVLRRNFRANIMDNLWTEDSASLALAITTGDRSMLGGELRSSVYLTGVGHIMALSGLHVSILAGLIMALLRKAGLGRGVASLLTLLFLIMFVVFAGPSPSLIRAVLMSVYAIAAFLTGRERLGMPALLWTGFVMLLYNPLWVFDYAFVYSFLATFVCLLAGTRLDKYLSFLPESIKRVASVSIIILLTAMPLNLYLFGNLPLWAPLANVVIIPLMPFMAAASFVAGLTSGAVGGLVSFPASILLNGVSVFLKLLNQYPLGLQLGGMRLVLTAVVSIVLLLYLVGLSKKYIAVFLVITVLSVPTYTFLERQVCSIWFLDVGQGDAILIKCQGHWILVDCGESYAGSRAVVPTLKYLGVDRLDAIIITHPHSDHAGGLKTVMESFPVDQVLVNSCFMDSEWVGLSNLKVVRGEVGILSCLKVVSHHHVLPNPNDNSLLVSLEFNKSTVLLTGDIEEDGEKMYFSKLLPHQVLKVAHHGSNTSTSVEFLGKVQPRDAIITCGLGNRYGFPNINTLDKLEQAGVTVYRTDLSGYVRLVLWPWEKYSIFSFMGR